MIKAGDRVSFKTGAGGRKVKVGIVKRIDEFGWHYIDIDDGRLYMLVVGELTKVS